VSKTMEQVRRDWQTAIEGQVQDKRIPSISYALVDRDGVLTSGHACADTLPYEVGDDSVFRVGSCSKMFTGIALMQFAAQGKIDLDEDVSTYIPGFAPRNPLAATDSPRTAGRVTLRKLMSHTSGMVREASLGHYLDDSPVSMDAMIDELKTSTLKENPDGGVFRYSNAGIGVVGCVIQQLAGTDFARYVQQSVLAPLGMHDSSFVQTESLRRRLCPAYMWTFDEDIPAPVFDMGGGGAAGNLFSTIPDMCRFMRAMLRGGFTESGGSVLSTKALHSMWEPIGRCGDTAYGLTFGVGDLDGWRTVGHNGAVYGYATQLTLLPEAGLGVVLCATLDATNEILTRLGQYGLRLALASRGMGQRPDPLPTYRVIPACQLATAPGDFVAPSTGERVRIVAKDGRLYLLIDDLPLRLQADSDTEFVIDGRVFGPGGPFPPVRYVSGEGGQPDALHWKGTEWTRATDLGPEVTPDEYLPFVGKYGPDFNVTHVFHSGGRLKCTIEYFFTHSLERVSEKIFKMHGPLYEGETLEFDARDARGRRGILVGPMFLFRHREV